jgi:plasmid stability protein
MRTTLELPDELMRHLKARAALEGRSLRDLTQELIERGLHAPAAVLHASPPLPSIRTGHSIPIELLSHAALMALVDGA